MLAPVVENKVTRTGVKGRKAAAEPQRARRTRAMSERAADRDADPAGAYIEAEHRAIPADFRHGVHAWPA